MCSGCPVLEVHGGPSPSFLLSVPTMSTFTQLFQRHCGGTRFQEHVGDRSLSCSKKMGKHLVHFAFIGLHPAVALTNYIPLLRILLLMRVSVKCQRPELSVTKPTPCLTSVLPVITEWPCGWVKWKNVWDDRPSLCWSVLRKCHSFCFRQCRFSLSIWDCFHSDSGLCLLKYTLVEKYCSLSSLKRW